MKALITGASSGIGRDMATILSEKGYELILVARRKEKLEELAKKIKTKSKIICLDLSNLENCKKLYDEVAKENIDILINNAGFGKYGDFEEVNLDDELKMIETNIKSVHVLTKMFLKDFENKNSGYILNVASIAGFMAGPKMATYYATKNYVLKLTMAINEELRYKKSNVYVGALCPGPVNTEFFDVAGVNFLMGGMESKKVAEIAIKNMFKKKMIIIPGTINKIAIFFSRFVSYRFLLKIAYKIQEKRK